MGLTDRSQNTRITSPVASVQGDPLRFINVSVPEKFLTTCFTGDAKFVVDADDDKGAECSIPSLPRSDRLLLIKIGAFEK
jgi:hypothetical protein